MAERVFYWCHDTAQQWFETGIQRVTRRLARALVADGVPLVALGWDDTRRLAQVIDAGAPRKPLDAPPIEACLLVPELTADLFAIGVDPVQLGRAYGMRVVVLVHDLIPLKLRSHYGDEMMKHFELYYASLANADHLVATTHYVADDLTRYFAERAVRAPPITVVSLPAQFGDTPRASVRATPRLASDPLRLVVVSSWEPRKNLVPLLRAFARARTMARAPLGLTLVGRRGFLPDHDREVMAAATEAGHVTLAGPLSDTALRALIESCDASVYPSLEEGFGLPIGESLWLGTPCLCHNGSSMAEIAPGGGTVMIDMADEGEIAKTLAAFATEPELLQRSAQEIPSRPLTSWSDYAAAFAAVLSAHFRNTPAALSQ